jgi:hypothetical protein
MAMVSNRFLAAVCVKLDFHRHLRSNGDVVEFQIREYVAEIREAEEESNGSPDYWTGVEAPKVRNLMRLPSIPADTCDRHCLIWSKRILGPYL